MCNSIDSIPPGNVQGHVLEGSVAVASASVTIKSGILPTCRGCSECRVTYGLIRDAFVLTFKLATSSFSGSAGGQSDVGSR